MSLVSLPQTVRGIQRLRQIAQVLTKRLFAGSKPKGPRKVTYPVDLPGRLRLHGERRKNATDSENDREPDQPHGHLV